MKDKNTTWNGLLKTIFATTFSIVLTFGTAALIERHKQAKEKRQIVLMLMYDLDNSMNQARQCDSIIQGFVEIQTQIERQKIEAASGVKENVWETKIPSVRDPWLKAIENTSIQ